MVCAGKGTKLCRHTFSGIDHKYSLFLKYKKTPPRLLRPIIELAARQAESFIIMIFFILIYISNEDRYFSTEKPLPPVSIQQGQQQQFSAIVRKPEKYEGLSAVIIYFFNIDFRVFIMNSSQCKISISKHRG